MSDATRGKLLPRIAVVGCGAAAREFFLPVLARYPNFRDAVVLVDQTAERVEQVANEFGIQRTATDHRQLPIDVDAAMIATPHHFHARQACDFLQQGRHVFVEKPLATCSAEVDEMLDIARQNGVVLMVNNYRRLFPAYRGVREELQSGELGRIKRIVIRDGTKFAWKSASAFYVRDVRARGVFLDRGAHSVDVLCWWLGGEPTIVEAQHDARGGVEGMMRLQLVWQDAPIELHFSRFYRLENDYSIECEHGTIRGRLFNFSRFQVEREGEVRTIELERPKPHYEYAWELASGFIDAARKVSQPSFTAEDVAPSLRVIERGYEVATEVPAPWYDSDPNIAEFGTGSIGKILVTGATGFVGGWIVEAFGLAGVAVRAGVRSWSNAVRLARRTTEMAECDVLSRDSLRDAMRGCDAVVHCAVGDQRVTVEGTRNVLAMARERGLKRVIHLSSVAVYGKADGTIDELYRRQSKGNPYAQAKIDAECVVEEFVSDGMTVIGLRPSIIYGPFGEAWTVSFVRRLASGRWGTFGARAEGTCNLVYVTDVAQAVFKALRASAPASGFYNINGDEQISWNEYFRRLNTELGRRDLRPMPTWPIVAKAWLFQPLRSVARYALDHFGSRITTLHAKSALAAKYMNLTESSLKLTPTREQLKLYGVRALYPIDKARTEFGYQPQVNIGQGLAWCAAWAQQQGIV